MLDRLQLDRKQKNMIAAYSAGALFAIGWWFIADANAVSNYWNFSEGKVTGVQYVPAIFATLSLIILNSIPSSIFSLDAFSFDGESTLGAKLVILTGFLMAFGSLFGAIYIFADQYMANPPQPTLEMIARNPDGQNGQLLNKWPGIAVFLQNILLFTANMTMRFGRKYD